MFYQSLLYPLSKETPLQSRTISFVDEKKSISIDQIHMLQRELSVSFGTQEVQTFIISPADALTLPAQQALLKTLEEPPENVQIILQTDFPHKLLPTILSRCTVSMPPATSHQSPVAFNFPKSISDCIEMSDVHAKDREKAIEMINGLLSDKNLLVQKSALRAIKRLAQNCNAKLVLDEFFFKLMHEAH